jgi:penicillin-binding protein 1A
VSVLDMAHAYESFASGGNLVYGSLSPGATDYRKSDETGTAPGPVGIEKIEEPDGSKWRTAKLLNGHKADNKTYEERILDEDVAATEQSILQGVVRIGSGKRAAVGGAIIAGKTGTTENYGDAWFVGWSEDYTVAVWVGYPDSVKSMSPPNFSFAGEPVAGGTYPASIFSSFMTAALAIKAAEEADDGTPAPVTGATGVTAPAPTTAAPSTDAPEPDAGKAAPETQDTAPDTGAAAPQDSAPPPDDSAPPPSDTGGAGAGGGAEAPSG